MTGWMYLLLVVGVLLVTVIAVALIRAWRFTAKEEAELGVLEVTFDKEKAVQDLAKMIRVRTISDFDKNKEDAAEFERFIVLLEELFPNVHQFCKRTIIKERGIIYHLTGKQSQEPTILMSHFDVVSVIEENWKFPPFDGIIRDGELWGRGTLDTKATLNAILQAAEKLLLEGFVPERDMYFAFSGSEEVIGEHAPLMVEWFEEQGIVPGMVLDEGGAVVENVFPGVHGKAALVGIAEKGMLNLELVMSGNGGHASAPPSHTFIGSLGNACYQVEKKMFRAQFTKPVLQMFDTLGRHSSFAYRVLFSNLWLFGGLFQLLCKKKGGELNAMLRTTCAFTQMEGSKGINVLPGKAVIRANLRLLGKDTMGTAAARIQKLVGEDITVNILGGMNPSRESRTDNIEWDTLSEAIRLTWPGAIVSPYLMVACSDARHYGKISDKVYRFSAMELSAQQRGMIHGNDERIPIETIHQTVAFYLQLMSSR